MNARYIKVVIAAAVAAAFLLFASVFGREPAGMVPPWRDVSAEVEAWLPSAEKPHAAARETAAKETDASPENLALKLPSSDPEIRPALISLNIATAEQLVELPGIGIAKAEAIVAYRAAHGSFARLEDVMNVRGIGPAIFGKIKGSVTLENPASGK